MSMATEKPRIRLFSLAIAVIALLGLSAAGCEPERNFGAPENRGVRERLLAALRPSKLANCTLRRYGDADDGGYVMCENLMGDARAAYSYGIDGRDQWGCDISRQMQTTVHEYDCFNLDRPLCERGSFQFHEECIGDQASTVDRRRFDTLANQVARNGDSGKRLIVKMDVEGAEWASLLASPDAMLDAIDQLVIEFHGTDSSDFLETVEKLKQHFYVANLHANNWACDSSFAPLTSWANEVLFVNKRIGVLDPSGGVPAVPSRLDAPNNPSNQDCQVTF